MYTGMETMRLELMFINNVSFRSELAQVCETIFFGGAESIVKVPPLAFHLSGMFQKMWGIFPISSSSARPCSGIPNKLFCHISVPKENIAG